ncbi:energy transducer TonB [Hymenobacter lutimineralis]|uniref:Energy transducer TonB n=1 Tax=Hymenobacter lutimineralis TaxID=2606448 RepID=A0A5D6VAU1_9BACT|nr:energy transducer TonB [Hymenobacter lutimineralis]TYZ12460.1 energy transducer TonB [Hymenobacter lutimineralis]
MSTLNLLTASLDDIVFEGRNKAYGAFVIRQLYHRHLQRAVILATALFLLLIATPLLVQYLSPNTVIVPSPITDQPRIELTSVDLPKPQTAARPAVAPPVVRPPDEIVPTVKPDELVTKPDLKPVTPPTNSAIDLPPGTQVGPVAQSGLEYGTPAGSDSGKAAPAVLAPPKPFLTAEVMPSFVGGEKALGEYFRKHLRYPSLALRNQISGRVFVSFTVGASGEVLDVEVLKGLGYGTEEEASRVIKGMPHWSPGQQGGRAVPVRFTLPITFQFQ